jgi:regulator of replication initiation timing
MEEKMLRTGSVILIFHLALMFQACDALSLFYASPKQETEEFRMTQEEIRNGVEQLKVENKNLQRRIDTLREENQRIRDENGNKIAEIIRENELLNEQIDKLKEENTRTSDENQILTERLAKLQLEYETLSAQSYEPEEDMGKRRVKVLSGDGDLNSAKEMAKTLRTMGYEIKSVDYAPRPNFSRNTVFFAPQFREEAGHLVDRLGADAVSKPLSWSSVFDLIVVTGKAP